MEKKRYYYFDLAKGIGIFLVVMGHLEYISMPLRIFIVSFHMPLFFIISGMLIHLTNEEACSLKLLIKKKFFRMMIPYFSFSILYFIIEIIYMKFTGLSTWESIFENLYLSVSLYGVSVLWFLPALFFSEIIFIFIRKHMSMFCTGISVIFLTCLFYYLNYRLELLNMLYGNDFVFSHFHTFFAMIIRCFFSVSFLAIGYFLFDLFKKINLPAVLSLILGIACTGLTILLSQKNGAVDLHFLIFGNLLIYFLAAFAGSLGVLLICRSVERYADFILFRIIRYYGVNSLIVMATHINSYILYGATVISLHLINYIQRARNYVFCGTILLIVFLSEIIVIEIINRFFPFMAGKTKN